MIRKTAGRSTRNFKRLRKLILSESTICWLCGHEGSDSIDHVIPLSVRPDLAEDPLNLRPAHDQPCPKCGRRCNPERGNRPPVPVTAKSRLWDDSRGNPPPRTIKSRRWYLG